MPGGWCPDEVVNRTGGGPDGEAGLRRTGSSWTGTRGRWRRPRFWTLSCSSAGFRPGGDPPGVDYNKIIARIDRPAAVSRLRDAVQPDVESAASSRIMCDLDGAALVVRDDDREAVIRERLEAYDRQTRPVLEYFAAYGQAVLSRWTATMDRRRRFSSRIRGCWLSQLGMIIRKSAGGAGEDAARPACWCTRSCRS